MAVSTRVALLLISLSFGCRGAENTDRPQPPAGAMTSILLDQRIGWIADSCLAIKNDMLMADSSIAIVSLADKPSIIDARLIGITTSSENCPALLADRRSSNVAKGWSFYQLQLPPGTTVELGIGVTGDMTRVNGGLDLTGDGVAEAFTQCATSEGVSFRVWSGTPYQGPPLWSGYYYLGYDVEANCPEH